MNRLDKLRAMLANATPPVWGSRLQGRDRFWSITIDDGEIEIGQMIDIDDAALIVAAVNALPALFAVVDAAEKVLDYAPWLDANERWDSAISALRAAVNAVKEEGHNELEDY